MPLVERPAVVEVAVFAASLERRPSVNSDVVARLIQLHHPAHVVITVHGSQMTLEVVLAVGRVAAVGTVEAFLESKNRFTVDVSAVVYQGWPAGDVIHA